MKNGKKKKIHQMTSNVLVIMQLFIIVWDCLFDLWTVKLFIETICKYLWPEDRKVSKKKLKFNWFVECYLLSYSADTLLWCWATTPSILLHGDKGFELEENLVRGIWWQCSDCTQLSQWTGPTQHVENCLLRWTAQRGAECKLLLFLCEDKGDLLG